MDPRLGVGVLNKLFTLAALTMAIIALYVGKEILLPVALAAFLSFILTPVVVRLERLRLGRISSVLLVVALVCLVAGGLAWVVTGQLVNLSGSLPSYRDNLIHRVRDLRGQTSGNLTQATQTIEAIGQELSKSSTPPAPNQGEVPQRVPGDATPKRKPEPVEVKVVALPPSPLAQIYGWLGPLVAPLTTAGIVIAMTIFMLLQREDLRNRVIELMGRSNLHATTAALTDATMRVSRYLRMTFLVNAVYGITIGLCLWMIGLPNAVLWGVLGFALRFLPYVGPWIAAGMPISLALAAFPGWREPLLVISAFIVVELICNNAIEPWLYGSSTGVSTMGVIISAIIWTWLWGPIGLVVSMPLTVCLVVASKYVPELQFIAILLGDRTNLTPAERIYQRLLAFDEEEARNLVGELVTTVPLDEFFEAILVPVLVMAEQDRQGGSLTEEQHSFLIPILRELVDESCHLAPAANPPSTATVNRPVHVLCVPVSDEVDTVGATMLTHLLRPYGYRVELGSLDLLTSEFVERIEREDVDIVILSAIPPLSTRNGRYLCRRIRERYRDLPIIYGLWHGEELEHVRRSLMSCGATYVVSSLREAVAQVRNLGPQPTESLALSNDLPTDVSSPSAVF